VFDARPCKPEGTPWLTPYLTVPDPGTAVEFYKNAFGFEVRLQVAHPDGGVEHAEVAYNGAVIMLGPESEEHTARAPMTTGTPSPVGLYLYTERLLDRYEQAIAAGAETISEPSVMFWGDRVFVVADPWGYKWTFAQNVADYDPQVGAR
jgi:PhnB protein